MKIIDKTIIGKGDVKGITFTRIEEAENGYIYKRSDDLFEVFEKRTQKEMTTNINGQEIYFEEKELYPNSNAFGIWAWECTTLANAQIRLMGMQKHERSPKSSINIPLQRDNAKIVDTCTRKSTSMIFSLTTEPILTCEQIERGEVE
ncbi:MAG: hypothetical protein PHC46_04315 [Clostridia bacterium]|nr:hypothetical protein [Clostridia bacterium]